MAAAGATAPKAKQKKKEKKSKKDKKEMNDKAAKKSKKDNREQKNNVGQQGAAAPKRTNRKRHRAQVDAQDAENAVEDAPHDEAQAASPGEELDLDLVVPDAGEDEPQGDVDADILHMLGDSVTDPAPVFPAEEPATWITGLQVSEQPAQSELEIMRELVETLLVEAGGEAPIGALEERVGEALGPEVLSSFVLDRSFNKIYLPGKQICSLLESPSFNAAAAEESYWQLGQEFLSVGLDFDNEDRFKAMLSDLLKKRDELREAARRGHITVSGNALELQPLGSMNDQERSLYSAVLSAFTTLQERQSWMPLSQVLDDAEVRRWRLAVPKGRRFWEWLDERFGSDLQMVTDGTEMLLHFAGYESRLRETAVARAEALELSFVSAVFDELSKRRRKDSRSVRGMDFTEICNLPAVLHLKLPQESMRRALDRRPETFEVLRSTRGPLFVTLQPSPTSPSRSPQLPHEARDDVTPQSLAEARALELRKAKFGDMPRKRSRLLTLPPQRLGVMSGQGGAAQDAGVRLGERKNTQQSRHQGLPPLPVGWIRRTSRSTGSLYYVNQKTGKSQFELPTHSATAPEDTVCLD